MPKCRARQLKRVFPNTFGFPFCQRLWDLTSRRDDIEVADMVADMVADKNKVDMELDMVADMEVDKVADKVADMVADKGVDKVADVVVKEITDFYQHHTH